MRKFPLFLIALASIAFGVCSPASAGCIIGEGIICRSQSAVDSLTYETLATETGGTSTATFSSVTFGTANSNRVLIFITGSRVTSGLSNTVSSANIRGVSASQVPSAAVTGTGGNITSDIWYASVPTGTSGTIVVNWANANTRSGICVYNLVTATPVATHGGSSSGQTALSLSFTASLTVPLSGYGVVGAVFQQTGNTLSFTNATQDVSGTLGAATNGIECGHTTSTGSVALTASQTPTSNFGTLSAASWSP
jgi:hypothetical protein